MSVSQLGSFRAKSWSAGYCADIKANFCLPCSLVKTYQARFSPSCALCSQLHLCKVVVNCYCLWTGKSFISPCALSTRLQKAACSADSDPLFLWSKELYLITKAHRKMCENSKNVGQVSERLNPPKCEDKTVAGYLTVTGLFRDTVQIASVGKLLGQPGFARSWTPAVTRLGRISAPFIGL